MGKHVRIRVIERRISVFKTVRVMCRVTTVWRK